jgi:hypothetical protein
MSEILQFLSKPWVGSGLGILGILAAVVFYIRSRKNSRLSFQRDEIAIIGGSEAAFPKEVTISFADSPVDRVTATRYVIWNSGNTTLSGAQIVQSDPLRLELKSDGKVLRVSILRVSRPVNAAWLKPREAGANIVDIGFDYLDPNDGLAIEVLHTGPRSDLNLHGTLRGLPSGATDWGRAAWYFDRRLRQMPFPFNMSIKFVIWISFLFGLLAVIAAIMIPSLFQLFPSLAENKASDPTSVRWPILFVGITYISLPGLLLWLKRRRYPPCLEPNQEKNSTERDDGPNEDSAKSPSS